MKEYSITEKDLQIIKDHAHQVWMHDAIKNEYFVVDCYVKATLTFINSRGLKLIDGKLYEPEKPKSS